MGQHQNRLLVVDGSKVEQAGAAGQGVRLGAQIARPLFHHVHDARDGGQIAGRRLDLDQRPQIVQHGVQFRMVG